MKKLMLWEAIQTGRLEEWAEQHPEYAYADAELIEGVIGSVADPKNAKEKRKADPNGKEAGC